jgi:hypothetical protein
MGAKLSSESLKEALEQGIGLPAHCVRTLAPPDEPGTYASCLVSSQLLIALYTFASGMTDGPIASEPYYITFPPPDVR